MIGIDRVKAHVSPMGHLLLILLSCDPQAMMATHSAIGLTACFYTWRNAKVQGPHLTHYASPYTPEQTLCSQYFTTSSTPIHQNISMQACTPDTTCTLPYKPCGNSVTPHHVTPCGLGADQAIPIPVPKGDSGSAGTSTTAPFFLNLRATILPWAAM